MKICIDDTLSIVLIEESHAYSIFSMVENNRAHLRPWLSFVDKMQTVDFAINFTKGCIQRNEAGIEFAFVIFKKDEMVGRVGVYKLDLQNKIGEIGYWIIESAQGKGIVTKACEAVLEFCFNSLGLHRIEIKCGVHNEKSKSIPEKLNFKKEGVLKEAELLYGQYIDLNLYALLKSEWISFKKSK